MKRKKANYPRIAFAKIGWAEDYRGDPVSGRAGWINQNGDAHERFNFLPGPDGRYYGYLPPIGKQYKTPQPKNPAGWLIIFVAPWRGRGQLIPVGWYEDATIERDWDYRPEYQTKPSFTRDVRGKRYEYAIHASSAVFIPPELREAIHVPGRPYFGQTPILYARGHGAARPWRQNYVDLALRIVRHTWQTQEKLSGGGGFASAKVAKEVEEASVKAVIEHLKKQGYTIQDRQKDNCGYDLLALRKKPASELHIEVKGTSLSRPRFFMTPNEYAYMIDPRWRLGMVTDALGSPSIELLNNSEVTSRFELSPKVWEGRPKAPSPEAS